jgi:prevent-host-death family protein
MSTSKSKTKLESNSVGVRELRQNASVLLRRVKAGEIIEITEHGTPIAKLVAVDPSKYGEYLEKKLETLIIPAKEPLSNLKLRDILDLPGRPLSEILQENRTAEKY